MLYTLIYVFRVRDPTLKVLWSRLGNNSSAAVLRKALLDVIARGIYCGMIVVVCIRALTKVRNAL